MSDFVEIGVMGAGGHWLTGHAPFLGDSRVVGLYDPSAASHEAAAKALGYEPPAFETPEDLVARRPDAIMIGSLDECHPQQLALAVSAGIPVLCEKPLAVDRAGMELVSAVLSMAQANGTLVASCHQRRSGITDLPYGWVKANLSGLEERYGVLKHIGLASIYPAPRQAWKRHRSFAADKYVHDIDWKRYLLGHGPFEAERKLDSHDHYIVKGTMGYGEGAVSFNCEGTRLHGDRGTFIEYILLEFERGTCVVYTKTGLVRMTDEPEFNITPMIPDSYDRLNREVTRTFLAGVPVHTPHDLLVNTTCVTALVEEGCYGYYPQ